MNTFKFEIFVKKRRWLDAEGAHAFGLRVKKG